MNIPAPLAGVLLLGLASLPACSGNDPEGSGAGSSDGAGTTGGAALGGMTATGATSPGGSLGSGTTGGTTLGGTASGGSGASGGSPASGSAAVGGISSSGGSAAAGGVTTTGGMTTSGGVATTGGVSATGATTATGGTTGGTMGDGGTGAVGANPPTGGSAGTTSVRPSPDRPSTDTTWSQGLTSGANGPIPFIVVDQFGYRTTAKKVAVIRDPQTGYDRGVSFTPGTRYAVVDQSSGTAVMESAPTAWNGGATDTSSGDKVWWFDFSEVTTPGTYAVVDLDHDVRSVQFEIDDDVYRSPLKHAVRMYYYQRAGFAKSAATAGDEWADGASHLGPGQDSEAHSWLAQTDESQVKDLRGGWYDAGDYNKYTAWTAGTAIALLRAYDEYPTAFGDDYGIEESGNGIPDLLDEVKWALDWIVRMQEADGSLLCILGLSGDSPPSATTGPSYYGPATTNATLMGAAVFAYASKIFGARPESNLQAYAADLATRAVRAWDWAEANPSVLYYNNDESRQPGSSGLGAGQQETDDAGRRFSKFQAAMYLYELTGDAAYQTFVESNYTQIVPSYGPDQWTMEPQDALLYYTRLSGISSSVSSAIQTQFVTNTTNNADQLPRVTGSEDPYRAPLTGYTWSSNQIKMAQARLYQLLAAYGSGAAADAGAAGAEDYVHYLHGVNPFGLVYLTNMRVAGAEHSTTTMFHTWFADGTQWDEVSETTPGPPPGYLLGGPNPSFELDSCCTAPAGDAAYQCYGAQEYSLCSQNWEPPMGQPEQKSYLDFNSGWPAGSWSISEPSTGYQAKYVLVLAAYAR